MEPANADDLPMFYAGRLSLAVDLYLQARLFEDTDTLRLTSALRGVEVAAIIETFLKRHDLWEAAEAAYAEMQQQRMIEGFEATEE